VYMNGYAAGEIVTGEGAGVLFAFLVCALALYKLLFGVDTRPKERRTRPAPTPGPSQSPAVSGPASADGTVAHSGSRSCSATHPDSARVPPAGA
jgi:hypothetical protein